MKTLEKLLIAALGALCLASVSCDRVPAESGFPSWDCWFGEYPVQTQNGSTGEIEDHTGFIALQFKDEGQKCRVETGLAGMYAITSLLLEARWTGDDHFALYRTAGGQSLLEYMGDISGSAMTLKACSCDGIAATYELSPLPLPE